MKPPTYQTRQAAINGLIVIVAGRLTLNKRRLDTGIRCHVY